MKLTWGFGLGVFLVIACGSSATEPSEDGGVGDSNIQNPPGDAATESDGFTSGEPTEAAIVVANGIVDATFLLTNGSTAQYQDVRVCVYDANKTAITKYALPDDRVMPLSNYPGVARGRGADLGSVSALGAVTVAFFNASDLSVDATWATSRVGYECASMFCESTQNPSCHQHATFQTTLASGVNVLALGDDFDSGNVKMTSANYDDDGFSGAEGDLWGTVINFSGWHDGDSVSATYGHWSDGTPPQTSIASTLTPNQATPIAKIATLTTYDLLGLRVSANTDAFGQSLDSIAFVSNPDVDPITFYDVRQNFVFALIGSPADPTSVLANGGRDLSFSGAGLHFVAIPYATPLPQKASIDP